MRHVQETAHSGSAGRVVLVLLLFAAFEFRMPATVQAGAALPGAANAVSLNPGLAGLMNRSELGADYCRPYDLEGLDCVRLGIGLRQVGLAGAVSVLNLAGYQEWTGTLAKAFAISRNAALGVALNGYYLYLRNELAELTAGLSFGAAYRTGIVGLGAAVHNFNRPALSNGDLLPVRALVGASIAPDRDLVFAADCEYQDAVRFRLGGSFQIHPALGLGLGLGLNPLSLSGGAKFSLHGLGASYSYAFHPRLKQTHIVGLSYSF
jgi:hypothetical protein